jgi:hypothetical protein
MRHQLCTEFGWEGGDDLEGGGGNWKVIFKCIKDTFFGQDVL